MFGDLPDHLSTLNHISSPPSNVLNPEHEEAFWDFMHTDQLFNNFGIAAASPSQNLKPALPAVDNVMQDDEAEAKEKQKQKKRPLDLAAPTLESFIAAFANEPAAAPGVPIDFKLPVPLPLPYNPASPSTAPTPAPAAGVDTAAIMPFSLSPDEDRITGAKRLKQIGAGPMEIEEEYVVFVFYFLLSLSCLLTANQQAAAQYRSLREVQSEEKGA